MFSGRKPLGLRWQPILLPIRQYARSYKYAHRQLQRPPAAPPQCLIIRPNEESPRLDSRITLKQLSDGNGLSAWLVGKRLIRRHPHGIQWRSTYSLFNHLAKLKYRHRGRADLAARLER